MEEVTTVGGEVTDNLMCPLGSVIRFCVNNGVVRLLVVKSMVPFSFSNAGRDSNRGTWLFTTSACANRIYYLSLGGARYQWDSDI